MLLREASAAGFGIASFGASCFGASVLGSSLTCESGVRGCCGDIACGARGRTASASLAGAGGTVTVGSAGFGATASTFSSSGGLDCVSPASIIFLIDARISSIEGCSRNALLCDISLTIALDSRVHPANHFPRLADDPAEENSAGRGSPASPQE